MQELIWDRIQNVWPIHFCMERNVASLGVRVRTYVRKYAFTSEYARRLGCAPNSRFPHQAFSYLRAQA